MRSALSFMSTTRLALIGGVAGLVLVSQSVARDFESSAATEINAAGLPSTEPVELVAIQAQAAAAAPRYVYTSGPQGFGYYTTPASSRGCRRSPSGSRSRVFGRPGCSQLVDWPQVSASQAMDPPDVTIPIGKRRRNSRKAHPADLPGKERDMSVAVRIWCTAVLIGCSAVFAPATKGDDWKAEHDAGWNAYKAGQLDEAERHLTEAEKQARVLGDNDPKLATTLDHLAWVLCSEGKSDKAEPLAKSALAIREKALAPIIPTSFRASIRSPASTTRKDGLPMPGRSMPVASRPPRKPMAPTTRTLPRRSTIWRPPITSWARAPKPNPCTSERWQSARSSPTASPSTCRRPFITWAPCTLTRKSTRRPSQS